MASQIVGINEDFNKQDKEMVSELIWDYVREHPRFAHKDVTGISYQINVDVQEHGPRSGSRPGPGSGPGPDKGVAPRHGAAATDGPGPVTDLTLTLTLLTLAHVPGH